MKSRSIAGRGANFILPHEERFAVGMVAPLRWRVDNISRLFSISTEEARRRVTRTESHRRAFIRKYFNADIARPTHYDLVVNSATLNVDDAVKVISASLDTLADVPGGQPGYLEHLSK